MTETEESKLSESIAQGERRWSYTSGTSDTPLLGLTIGDLFDQTVEKYPDHPALISRHQHIRLTYRELQAQVNLCAKGLMAPGLQKGQRIGIWSPNRAEWCITQFATSKIGAILVNINPAYRLHELEYALKQSECSAIIIAAMFKTTNYTELMYTVAPELNQCKAGKLKSAALPNLTTVICLGSEKFPGMFTWDELMAMSESVSADQLRERQSEQEFDDPINIQYTSGTTGFPKGATLSHHNILNNGYFVARLQNFTPKDMIIRGGENLYPREIEEFLYTHAKISEVQVIGVPDPKYGEEIMAWIKVKPGEQVTEEELKEYCKGKIAHYKIPRYIKFVDSFPMTVTGKVQKFLMRRQSTGGNWACRLGKQQKLAPALPQHALRRARIFHKL